MHILVIEDEHKIAGAIKRGLEYQSYVVDIAYNGDDGLRLATSKPYDLVILDRVSSVKSDSLDIIRTMRNNRNHTPVLLLTEKGQVSDRAEGLNAGADDYLVKPFTSTALVGCVTALLCQKQQAGEPILEYKDLRLNTAQFWVERSGVRIDLSAKEFALLEFLLRNPEKIVSKDTLIQHVWDYDSSILPNTVEVYIGYLRNKIDKPFDKPSLIQTKRGFGYCLAVH